MTWTHVAPGWDADEPRETAAGKPCHFCSLIIKDGEKAVSSNNTPGVWAHVTCWYDGGPFERDMLEQGRK